MIDVSFDEHEASIAQRKMHWQKLHAFEESLPTAVFLLVAGLIAVQALYKSSKELSCNRIMSIFKYYYYYY